MLWLRSLLAALLLILGPHVEAQTRPSPGLKAGAQSLVGFFGGHAKAQQIFTTAFLQEVPAAKMNEIARQLTEQLGPVRALVRIEVRSPTSGTVFIDFERGTLQLKLAVAAAAPHLIRGLLVTGTEMKGDNIARILRELKTLPGQTSFATAELRGDESVFSGTLEAARPMAIGSTFKLFLLAELSRSIAAGERKWTDVAPLDRVSLPSGFLQTWPKGAPLTLYSLAALMISQSDNTAADVLLGILGREKVENVLPLLQVKAAGRNRPFLSTMEAFALKAGPNDEVRKSWAGASEDQRRDLLRVIRDIRPDQIDPARLGGMPAAIDTVEWFASASDLVGTMDWLRRNGGREALEILAINPGIGSGVAGQYGYVGYKGGSERGVVNMTFLIRTKAGAWHVVTGSWNNPSAPVAEAKFALLMGRALALLR